MKWTYDQVGNLLTSVVDANTYTYTYGLPSMESVRRRQVVLWLRERCGISHPVGYSYVELAVKRGMAEMVDEKTVRFQSPSSGMTVEGVDPVRIAELGLDRAYGEQD